MKEIGSLRSSRLALEGKASTKDYGVIQLVKRDYARLLGCDYVGTDIVYEVDIYRDLKEDVLYGVDAFERVN